MSQELQTHLQFTGISLSKQGISEEYHLEAEGDKPFYPRGNKINTNDLAMWKFLGHIYSPLRRSWSGGLRQRSNRIPASTTSTNVEDGWSGVGTWLKSSPDQVRCGVQ